MNYIELINQFWKTRRISEFSSNEADLYFCLLQECNLRGWENPFSCSNRSIVATIGITEKTLIGVRNRLKQKGMIDFEAGKRKEKSPVYTLLYCINYSINDSKTGSIKVSKKVSKKVHSLKTKTETKTETNKDMGGDAFTEKTWRTDFEIYKENLRNGYREIIEDEAWFKKQQEFYPNVNILKSIEKACFNFWVTEWGWKNKKKSKIEHINWKQTFANAISQQQNKVYYERNTSLSTTGNSQGRSYSSRADAEERRRSVDDLTELARAILQQP